MQKPMWLMFLLLMTCFTSVAQPVYRLREPEVERYLTTIIENADHLDSLQIRIIITEVHQRFGDSLSTASFESLRTAFNVLFADIALDGYGYLPHQEQWERAKLLAWLRENEIDLTGTTSLVFEDYAIEITPVDFNGDGRDEIILHVVRGASDDSLSSSEYREFLVLDQRQRGEFERISTPLPWLSNQYHNAMSQSQFLKPVRIADVQGDGVLEWLVMSVADAGRDMDTVRLYVLGWRDGQLVDLAAEPIDYPFYRPFWGNDPSQVWSFTQEGQSSQIEQRVSQRDNWRCVSDQVTQYTWNGALFERTGHDIIFPDTFECLARQAESAVYAHDFGAAVGLYEQALALDQQADYADYITFRLALASAIEGEPERAAELLRELRAKEYAFDEFSLVSLVDALLPDDTQSLTAQALCLDAYNFFVAYPLYILNGYASFTPGQVTDNPVSDPFGPIILPENQGCDVAWLVKQSLEGTNLPIDSSPAEQLEQLGWPVGQTFRIDLNRDGIDEWLVWLDSEMLEPILFVSEGDVYRPTEFTDGQPLGYAARYPSATPTALPLAEPVPSASQMLFEAIGNHHRDRSFDLTFGHLTHPLQRVQVDPQRRTDL